MGGSVGGSHLLTSMRSEGRPLRPGRGERAEAGDDAGKRLEDVVDLLRRVVLADGQPQAAPGEVFGDAERGEDVGGLQRPAGAGAAAGGGDAGEVEGDEDRFAFDVLEAER